MNEPIALPAPSAAPRRVVLLVKSVHIAHQAGFYLLNGRWHKIHQDKPAPAGAPVVAEKPASGHTRMTSDMWAQVYAHADNSNKATFTKKLDKLKEAFEAGDEKAILAGSYPNDTTNKKVVKVANYLLSLMGSEHTVHAGLKQGTHHTLTGEVPAVTQPVEVPAPVFEAPPVAPEPVVEVPTPEPVAEVAAEPVALPEDHAATLAMPAFVEGQNTTGVVDYYQEVGQKVIALAAAGDVEGLHQLKAKGLEPNKNGKVGNTWKGKTENSKMLLAMQANAVAQIGGAALSAPVPAPVEVEAPAPASAKDSMGIDILASSNADDAVTIAFAYLDKVGNSHETVGHVVDALDTADYKDAAAKFQNAKDKAAEVQATLPGIGELISAVGDAGSVSAATNVAVNYILKNGDTPKAYDAAVMALMAHAYDGAAAAMGDAKPKEGDTKPGADGMLVLKDGHWIKMDQGSKQPMGLEVMQAYEQLFDDAELAKDEGKIKAALAEIEANYTGGKAKTMLLYGTTALQNVPPQPEAQAAPVDVHPIDAVPMPDLSNLMQPLKAQASLDLLKQQIKDHGVSALKGITKKMKASGKVITTLTTATTGKPFKITGYDGNGQSHDAIYHYVEALKAAASGKGAPVPKAKPAAPAAAPKAAEPAHPSMDDWKQIGPQGGSNPGGKFIDPEGVEWYCKFPGDENMAKSEVLAAKLYAAAGISSQDAKLVTKDGKIGIASKWADVTKASPAQLAKAKGAKAGFAVDAWLANHDVVGLEFDNLQLDASGNAMRVDAGGSLEYRAQGAKKEFGDTVTEIDTLRDKAINDKSAAVFGKMTKADITASVANVLKVSSAQIYALVNTYGPGTADDKVKLAATLIARKADLLAKYPKAKKEKKIEFKPENISAPPSFTNWGGTGNSGPSSKEFINQANEKAVQSIYAAAQTGNPESIKGLSADTFNKATGEVTGAAPVLDHPSQHVKGYAQQAMNEIHQQLNPPKVFRFDGGHPLHSLNAAYPALNSGTHGETVAKAGKFLVLGTPGLIDLPALGLEKASWANGQLDQKTYSPLALAIVNSMPVTQKQAIISYTGAGYGAMNTSLWSGNATGASKSAAEALNTLGHEIKPGTILSRKLSLSGIGLDQILASTGKILQEPAIMSTSIRPSSWSGNTQLKLHVGPGVKGLWVGKGSTGGSGGLSQHQGEDEMILPPNTRILVLSVKKVYGPDEDGFGNGVNHVIEAVILPSEQPGK